MSERGQIIIPKEIRKQVHADTNTVFVVDTLDKDTIVMKKLDSKALVEEFNRIRKRTKKMSSAQIEALIHEVREEKRNS